MLDDGLKSNPPGVADDIALRKLFKQSVEVSSSSLEGRFVNSRERT